MEKRTTEPMAAPVVLDYGSPKTTPRPPRPLAKTVFEGFLITGVGALVIGVLMPQPTRMAGAQRSVKIKWEERQREIEQVVMEQHDPEAKP